MEWNHISSSIEELVGHTPLIAPAYLQESLADRARLLLKLEFFNPAGSTKDRAALYMIRDAEARGILCADSVIVEPTSGNTGIGLAAVAATRGYRVILTMPDTMSVERRRLLAAYGAELVLTEGARGMQGAIEEANRIASELPHSFIPMQFENPANAQAHYETTGPELWTQTEGKIDFLVAGVGTGGTITGTGRFLKEKNPALRVVAVEPYSSAVLSGKKAGAHGLQGIGAGFVPKLLDTSILDEVFPVTDEDAYRTAQTLAKRAGLLTGISSGAALFAACAVGAREENAGKTIAVILPDTGERYLSSLYV